MNWIFRFTPNRIRQRQRERPQKNKKSGAATHCTAPPIRIGPAMALRLLPSKALSSRRATKL